MNRTLKLPVIAGLLFAAGAVAGRWILIDRDASPVLASFEASGLTPSRGPLKNPLTQGTIPTGPAFDDIQLAGFEGVAPVSLVSSNETITREVAENHAASTRSMISQRFPDLSTAVLAGWVDAYQDLPLRELEELLTEKQMMAEFMPFSSTLQSPMKSALLPQEIPRDASGTFTKAIQTVKHNLLHATTPGFRRSIIQTAVVQYPDSASMAVNIVTVFDFSPGPIARSANPIHLAIDDDGSHWFQLEQGTLLTRQGAFVRLNDGQPGIVVGDTTLRLATDIRWPETATDLQFEEDGTITFSTSEKRRISAGTLQLVQVSDLTKISSADGVFFTANDPSAISMTGEVTVRTGALESANVDSATELQWLNHFERLQALE